MTDSAETSNQPVLSICMPVYNAEDYLVGALDSVLAQSSNSFELIISDNASTDSTGDICQRYCERDNRIRYFRQEKNQGPNWNFGFVTEQANGQLMTFFAHDDILEPDYVEVASSYLLQHPETVLVTSDFQIIDEKDEELRIEEIEQLRDSIAWKDRQVEFFKNPNLNVYYCIYGMMRTAECKTIMRAVNEPRVATGSEFPILARFAVAGEIVSIPKVLRKYRRHASSVYMSEAADAAKASGIRRIAARLSNIYRLRFEQYGVLLRSRESFGSKCRILILASLAHKRLFFGAAFRAVFARK